MKVYDLLNENGFNINSNDETICNKISKNEYILDFLNRMGFKVLYKSDRSSMGEGCVYEYGSDSYSGRVKITFILDFTEQINVNFECKKFEK